MRDGGYLNRCLLFPVDLVDKPWELFLSASCLNYRIENSLAVGWMCRFSRHSTWAMEKGIEDPLGMLVNAIGYCHEERYDSLGMVSQCFLM